MLRTELQAYLEQLLAAPRVKDYCPNGLQVEGRIDVQRVVCGLVALSSFQCVPMFLPQRACFKSLFYIRFV